MKKCVPRRDFLRSTTAAGIGFWVAGGVLVPPSRAANSTIQFACIGVGGRGFLDSADCERKGNVAAICDVDERKLARKARMPGFQQARQFVDFREMFDVIGSEIDAVTVSTPDHTHAAVTAMAIRMGKHCFTQKPLARTVGETRALTKLAAEHQVATQMGNQGTAKDSLRLAAAAVKSGVLGDVREVHVFTDRPNWRRPAPLPPKAAPVPSYLHWDAWLGPAAQRPYAKGQYHPFLWRNWWDFGTGALGDMACHTANMPFAALDLRDPRSVVAETSGHDGQVFPESSVIRFEFAASEVRGPVQLTWYDGRRLPPESLLDNPLLASCRELVEALTWSPTSGTPVRTGALLIGERGVLFGRGDYCDRLFFIGIDRPKELNYEKSPGHFDEWINAIRFGQPAMANFVDYAGPLTETVLIGNLAVRVDGARIEWDAASMTARVENTDSATPALQEFVQPAYREGYEL
jgi:predicted dehydrogenase